MSVLKSRKKLTDAEIVALYVSGLDSLTVSLQSGVDPTTVLSLVRAAGETVRPRGGKKIATLNLAEEEIVRRYKRGESGPQLAEAAGCSLGTVYSILRRHKTPMRAPINRRKRPNG